MYVYSSTALEDSAVTGARTITEVVCTNTSASVIYLQLFDSATLPANATAPLVCIAVPAGTTVSYDPSRNLQFAEGCVAAGSTTAATLTVSIANEQLFYVR